MDGLTVGIILFFLFSAMLIWCNMTIFQPEKDRMPIYGIQDLDTQDFGIQGSDTHNSGEQGSDTHNSGEQGSDMQDFGIQGSDTRNSGEQCLGMWDLGVQGMDTQDFGIQDSDIRNSGGQGLGIYDLSMGHIPARSTMYTAASNHDIGRTGLLTAWILTMLLAVLLTYYFSYYLYEKKRRERKMLRREEAGKREAEIYLESIETHYQRIRELWHDLKNHITLLNMLLQEGKYSQMEDYLRIFAEDVDGLALPMKSGNLVVDALLADKLAKAGKKGISVQLSLCDLTNLLLKPNEICGLLGNLLDNALEAGQQAEEKLIAVECEETEYCYYIRVQNSMKNVQGEGGVFHSVKTDRRNQAGHGIGLRSVERIVHSCGGELLTDSTGNCFTAR